MRSKETQRTTSAMGKIEEGVRSSGGPKDREIQEKCNSFRRDRIQRNLDPGSYGRQTLDLAEDTTDLGRRPVGERTLGKPSAGPTVYRPGPAASPNWIRIRPGLARRRILPLAFPPGFASTAPRILVGFGPRISKAKRRSSPVPDGLGSETKRLNSCNSSS